MSGERTGTGANLVVEITVSVRDSIGFGGPAPDAKHCLFLKGVRASGVISDPTGNWTGYVQKAAGTTDLNQSRTHNHLNEIDVDDNHADSPGASIAAATE